MNKTTIAWATHTWNPVSGCSKISEGCRNCYAERISRKFNFTQKPWSAANAQENIVIFPERLKQVDKLKPGQRIFVNSMSDIFHEAVTDEFIKKIFWKCIEHPEHNFIVLTKRSERLAAWPGPWTPNIWAGVSIESQKEIGRLADLKASKCLKKIVSFEPLLGPVEADLSGLWWVIAGGESGPNYRPMEAAWARTLRDTAKASGVAFFFKQFPGLTPGHSPNLDGLQYHEIPQRWQVQPCLKMAE